jgi:hypothetical protein
MLLKEIPYCILDIPPPYCTMILVELTVCLISRGNSFRNTPAPRPSRKKNEMAPLAPHRKRKQTIIEQSDASDSEHFPVGGLDLLSEDEDEDGPVQESDNDDVDAFPEIDVGSDTDEEDERSSGDNEDHSESEGEEQDDEDASSDDDLHIFPRAKTVISGITGQRKKVYPEIEPDYDSDSSTEDVHAFPTSVVPF